MVALLVAGAAYARVLDGEFQFDDRVVIEEAPAIKHLGPFLSNSFMQGWTRAGRPLTDLTFALNYAAGRLHPRGYHAVNLVLHLLVALSLWRLGVRFLERAGSTSQGPAALAAAAFVLHPLGSQAVSYIAQRAEVLASLFYVGALLLVLDAQGSRRPWLRLVLALACALAGLGAKPIVITLPFAVGLIFLALGQAGARWSLRARVIAGTGILACAGFAFLTLRELASHADAGFHIPGLGPGVYLRTQARVVLMYLRLILLPTGQNLDPDIALSHTLDGRTLLAMLGILALMAAAALAIARAPRLSPPASIAARCAGFGVLWFFVLLAPTSSFIPVADVMFEHRAYLAMWGVLFALANGGALLLARLPERWRAWLTPLLSASLCLSLATALWARNAVWQSKLALWQDVAAKSPRKARAHVNLGHALEQLGKTDEAAAEYRTALTLPGESISRLEVLRNLGAVEIRRGNLADAETALEEGRAYAPRDAELLNNLAILALERNDAQRAQALAEQAVEAAPKNGAAWNTLGEARLARGDAAAALPAFERGAALDPDKSVRHWNVALALDRLGRTTEACAAIGQFLATERDPAERQAALEWSSQLGCAGN